jgi:uncharacterized protein YdeI (YjbR/CyaY-like superfamily)
VEQERLTVAKLDVTDPVFFATPAEFDTWLAANHDAAEFLWVGYYKKATGKPSVTWEETVDEALCYGWIDGIRKSLGDESYVIRFTPRKPRSVWSGRNIDRVAVLRAADRMQPSGMAAYANHDAHPNSGYRTAESSAEFAPQMLADFKANAAAWAFYQSQAPGYRRHTTRWVMSAKREDTRARRMATLIADAANGLKIKQLRDG